MVGFQFSLMPVWITLFVLQAIAFSSIPSNLFWQKRVTRIDQEIIEGARFRKTRLLMITGRAGLGNYMMLKQMRNASGDYLTNIERNYAIHHIHELCITQMQLVVDSMVNSQRLPRVLQTDGEAGLLPDISELSKSGQEAANLVSSLQLGRHGVMLNDTIVAALKTLWSQPAIKRMYAMRNVTKIEESSAYFWNKLDELNHARYIPSDIDCLLGLKTTHGPQFWSIDWRGHKFSIFEELVSGRKSGKKWVAMTGVRDVLTAVIFVVNLSCYDEVIHGEHNVNAMTDQLRLFDEVCNKPGMARTDIIVIFNKKELFARKIMRGVPLTICDSFRTFSGSLDSFDETSGFVRKVFISLNKRRQTRNIFTHFTNDDDNGEIMLS